jgi:hypothetical protein
MNRDEQVVFEYLKKLHGENVVFEPEHNNTPDFSVNSCTAVEVRRLNQHFFENEKPEGLENLSIPLFDAFREVLESLNYLYAEKSYWVFIDYKRPLSSSIHQAKKDMELALREFLDLNISKFPYEIPVNSEITFSFYESNPGNGKLFPVGGSDDSDAGGWVISVYAENIRHCIDEKSSKISKHLQKYSEWWLFLVDWIGFWIDTNEIAEVIKLVGDTGNFDKVCILSYDGQNVLTTMSKRKA